MKLHRILINTKDCTEIEIYVKDYYDLYELLKHASKDVHEIICYVNDIEVVVYKLEKENERE